MIKKAIADPSLQNALTQCREMITVGSKSFSAAARFFGQEEKESAFFLYGWCRFCDDQIDEAEEQSDLKLLRERLAWLKINTARAFENHPSDHPVFVAFSHIVKKYQIPHHYPLELLAGMEMDTQKMTYPNFEALTLYCYRVAGVVGLMMAHIVGVSDARALKHAADLGIAMQLTNIARDVTDDAKMGRVYLPLDWLREEGVPFASVGDPKYLSEVARVVARLLQKAESYYQSGDQGLKYLAFRPAVAVVAARCVYSEIGREVLRRGPRAWDERVWIRPLRKWIVMGKGIGSILSSIPRRLMSPWHRLMIPSIWRHV